jgi:serine/threonine-protein kinase
MLAGRYRIVGLLGRGGMGEVYRADDLKLGQPVALKFLPEALARDGAALARFHREVRVARQLAHPNVCRVYDIGEADGRHFLSMEHIDGEDLASLLRRIGRLPSDKAVEIARQLCAGLAAAHDSGVLHRDLKPANIMVDGRGKARITDFGLAGLAGEFRDKEVSAGTPAYMAPEQLAGKEVTVKSDIYSLGLVLYEVFTGKPVFEARTIEELMRLREQTTPTSPSSLVKDIDPLVERVILRCLEKEPSKRPASAIQVAAALPGGDPLAAALAAGETPSPEMVAAAGEKSGLRPKVAVACLAAVIAGLIIIAFQGNKDWRAQVLHENSPEALAHTARDIIKRLGYTDRPTDSAFGLRYNGDYLQYLELLNRGVGFSSTDSAAIIFWYRESPRYLEASHIRSGGWVSETDPPQDVSGMVKVELDPQGRLIRFAAVPTQKDQSSGASPPPDWTALFGAAGLDPARFTPTEPKWTPLAVHDARAAWTGAHPDQAELPLRIEAAAHRGKPVYFETIGPWMQPWPMQPSPPAAGNRLSRLVVRLCLSIALVLGAVILARSNFRQGRGDRRGAFRLAIFFFAVRMLGWLFGASHVPTDAEAFSFFFLAVSQALLLSGFLWLFYLALEPYVRRRWPNTIISWSRGLGGSLRDPLVGRDVLVGVLFGVAMSLFYTLESLSSVYLAAAPPSAALPALLGARYLISYGFLHNPLTSILVALMLFFLFFLLCALTRRQWLAATIFILIGVAQDALGSASLMGLVKTALFSGLYFALIVVALRRFGLVALAASLFVVGLLRGPGVLITTDLSAWYAGSSLAVLLAVLALAVVAFRTALGGQKVFEGKLLEE